MAERIPTQRLLMELQYVTKSIGRPPSANDFQKHGEFGKRVITKRFASWPAARRAAGLPSKIIGDGRHRTPESVLLDGVRDLAREIGKIPAASDMAEHGDWSVGTYKRRFGSWENARQKAGFPDENQFIIQTDTLLQALRDIAADRGRPPTQGEMKQNGPYSPQTYNNRFGTYNTAVLAAGLEPNSPRNVELRDGKRVYGPSWSKQRAKALDRDGLECVVCGLSQQEHRESRNESLHVHHLKPVREFDDPKDGNQLDNLVTLCAYCHGRFEDAPEKLAAERRSDDRESV